jgi:hypothetical protein
VKQMDLEKMFARTNEISSKIEVLERQNIDF